MANKNKPFEVATEGILENFRQQSKYIRSVTDDMNKMKKDLASATTATTQSKRRMTPPRSGTKIIKEGAKGGLYYVKPGGRRMYLTPSQCGKCEKGTLPNSVGCPPANGSPRRGRCQPSRASLKRTIENLKRSKRRLKRKLRDC